MAALDGREAGAEAAEAAGLLAAVVGQDLVQGDDGAFRIARPVAEDRTISTVDPEARHGHKSAARGFDGYKGHIAEDPDSEIITATAVTAGNADDAEAAETLLAGNLPPEAPDPAEPADPAEAEPGLGVYGDAAYGAGALLDRLEKADADVKTKVQPPSAPAGHFTKDDFTLDLRAGTAACPAGITAALRPAADALTVLQNKA